MTTTDLRRRRLVQLSDVDDEGRRWPVLVTADPHVIAATERAVRERVAEELGTSTPSPTDRRPR